MLLSFDDYLDEELKDPEFKREWDALEPEFQLIREMMKARNEQNLSEGQLAERTGISEEELYKIEMAEANPTLQTLKDLAAGFGMVLNLSFKPIAS